MPLVPKSRSGCEKEGPGDHGENEREAEEQEGVALERRAVGGGEGGVVGRGAEFPGLKDRHGGRTVEFIETVRK